MQKQNSGNDTSSAAKTTSVRCAFCAQWAIATCQYRKPGRVVHLKDYCSEPICKKHMKKINNKPMCPTHSPKQEKKKPHSTFWNNLFRKN